ncbi:TDT family transporter [Enterococcus sp. 2201sp1_2201st1_B8_2201SCRN_220225]|uniref:TDT family transporter n=1 Tax=unclassified Enterococcus TaxID=2608891 RepID=UPI0034A149C4
MKHFLKAVPIPMCGLILGLASLGNLMKAFQFTAVGNAMGIVAGCLMILILARLFFLPLHSLSDLKNPIVASVAPTFTMALMVLCTYLTITPGLTAIATIIWFVAVVVHYLLVFYFTYNFVIKPQVGISHVFPSWFIVFVGMGVVAVTSPSFSLAVGQLNFWIALVFYVLLLPIIIYRVFVHKQMPEATLPLMTIVAAPGSLCLTGYLKSFTEPNATLAIALLLVSQILYYVMLSKITRLRLNFYPSFAAFTFPLVISAIAITTFNQVFAPVGTIGILLSLLSIFETIVATAAVFFVLAHYLHFLYKEAQGIRHHQDTKELEVEEVNKF